MGKNDGVEMLCPIDSDTATLIGSHLDQHNIRDAGATHSSHASELPRIFQGEMEQDDDGMAITCIEFYARDCCWSAAVYCAFVCSGGLLALLARWMPDRKLKITHSRCDAASAHSVLIYGSDGKKTVADLVRGSDSAVPHFFDYRHVRHYLRRDDPPAPAIYQIRQPIAEYHQQASKGLSNDEVHARQHLVGSNLVKVPVKSHLVLLIEEVLNPFYVFQVWSVTIWLLDDYIYYAICVAFISLGSAVVSLVSMRQSLLRISEMAYHQADVRVLRNSSTRIISSEDLVPGDVVILSPQDTVPADLILVSGSVIVDESMLTGESVPETSNDFFRDAVRFICVLAFLASIGMIYQTAAMTRYGASLRHLILGACDIVTIAVPPALPAAICIGLEMAMNRLRKLNIYCTSPSRVNPAGQVEVVCFDKTGTLTTDRIDVVGCVPASISPIQTEEKGASVDAQIGVMVGVDKVGWHMFNCLALCHSLVPAPKGSGGEDELEGAQAKYLGDPLEIATFAATKSALQEEVVYTSSGKRITCPVVTSGEFAGARDGPQQPRELARGFRDSPIPSQMQMGGRGGADSKDELHVLDEVAPQGSFGHEAQNAGLVAFDSKMGGGAEGSGWALTSPEGMTSDAALTQMNEMDTAGKTRDFEGLQVAAAAHDLESFVDMRRGLRVGERAAVLRRFAFTSEALRSSVIVAFEHVPGTFVYVKGAPEVLVGLCEAHSVPRNIAEQVAHHTCNGRRVLACAYRACGASGCAWAQEAQRGSVETQLVWAGLLVMENTLKADSKDAVDQLVAAGLHCAMVTGDHSLTAISVARRCGILRPERIVLLCKVRGEDGGGEGERVADEQDTGSSAYSKRLVFHQVMPVQAGPTQHVKGVRREQARGEEEEVGRWGSGGGGGGGGGGESASAPTTAPGSTPPAPLSLAEARAVMVGAASGNETADEHGALTAARGGDIEVAVTGAALDVLLCLLNEGAERNGLTAAAAARGARLSVLSAGWWSREKRPEKRAFKPMPPSQLQNATQFTPASPSPCLSDSATCSADTAYEMARHVLRTSRVFARCSPVHKQQLVTTLAQELPAVVAFCGDGANDCGALKAAHVGLSLSDAESSIAAPFTSSTHSVHAMVDLIREGRAALVSSVASFKFMALYSLTQLVSVLRMYQVNATLTDGMFLWVDLFLVLPFVVTMSQTSAAKGLFRLQPQGRLVSPPVLASIFAQVALVILLQMLVAHATHAMPFFQCDDSCQPLANSTSASTNSSSNANGSLPLHPLGPLAAAEKLEAESPTMMDEDIVGMGIAFLGDGDGRGVLCWSGKGPQAACCKGQPLGCPTHPVHPSPKVNCVSVEATAAFCISQFQYLSALMAFSTGAPYRLHAFTNVWLVLNALVALLACVSLTHALNNDPEQRGSPFLDAMQLVPFPDPTFGLRLLLLAVAAIAAALCIESVIENLDNLLAFQGGAIEEASGCDVGGAEVEWARADFKTLSSRVVVALANVRRGQGKIEVGKILMSGVMFVGCVLAAIILSFSS